MLLKLLAYIFMLILLAGLALAFGSENQQLVDVNLLLMKIQLPLGNLLFITFVSGIGLTFLWSLIRKLSFKSNA